MNMIKKSIAAIAIGLASMGANASTIDFQNLSFGDCAYYGYNVSSGGFDFTGNPADGALFGCSAGLIGGNTSNALINANSRSMLTMTRTGGGVFDLTSFYAGSRFDYLNPNGFNSYGQAMGMDLVGTVSGGGTVNASITFNGGNFAQYLMGAGFSNLTSVTMSVAGLGDTIEFLIDDIVVDESTQVPEPGSLALLGLGILGLAAQRRRKQA
jgi:hypothetical protein